VKVTVHPGDLAGRIAVPGSKSHTIRALLIAALADGESLITGALHSEDTAACVGVLRSLGVRVDAEACRRRARAAGFRVGVPLATSSHDRSTARTRGRRSISRCQSLRFRSSRCRFTGDAQLQRRSAGPLLAALEATGARVDRENAECVPFTVTGPLRGGAVTIECPTSQYLSSLLLSAPLTARGMEITVPLLNERPYVEMTMGWLREQGIDVVRSDWSRFEVAGGRWYRSFSRRIPADFSSATFLLAAAAVTGSRLTLDGVEMSDTQGDKEVVHILDRLGCSVETDDHSVTIAGPDPSTGLRGGEIDLNAMPDALPALAVVGTCCREPLRLANVPQAREKETDRIAVMTRALTRWAGALTSCPTG
jgi:3-phosphoshikimate 1-carboxyvinyltransferase